MKRLIYAALSILALLSSCKDEDAFVIKGKLSNQAPNLKKVYLYQYTKDDIVLIDSGVLDASNRFEIRRLESKSNLYALTIDQQVFEFIAQGGDELELEANLQDKNHDYKISGNEDSQKLHDLNQLLQKETKESFAINDLYQQKIAKDTANAASYREKYLAAIGKWRMAFDKKIWDFAEKNKHSIAAVYAVKNLDEDYNEARLIAFAQSIKGKLPDNAYVNGFIEDMEGRRSLQIGNKAPEFQAPDREGKMRQLAEFNTGKYLLVDFWASWCQPCREENPNLVKVYTKYHDQGFNIVGVSLDATKAAWEKAIAADQLNWNHLSELNYWNSSVAATYHIKSIPNSFLLDNQGKIVAKSLRAAELDETLGKLLATAK